MHLPYSPLPAHVIVSCPKGRLCSLNLCEYRCLGQVKGRMGVVQYERASFIHMLNHSFKYLLTSYENAKQGCLLKGCEKA